MISKFLTKYLTPVQFHRDIHEATFLRFFVVFYHVHQHLRICFANLFSIHFFYPYGNYFSNDGRRMIEFGTSVYRRTSWLWFLEIHLVLFLSMYRVRLIPRIRVKTNQHYGRRCEIKWLWLWFGFMHRMPSWFNTLWMRYEEYKDRKEMEKMYADPNCPFHNDLNEQSYEDYSNYRE